MAEIQYHTYCMQLGAEEWPHIIQLLLSFEFFKESDGIFSPMKSTLKTSNSGFPVLLSTILVLIDKAGKLF